MPTPDIQIALHIGAHKTATTHLQRAIPRRLAAMAEHGVHFLGPRQLRVPGQSLNDRFGVQWPGRDPVAPVDLAAALAVCAPQGRRLLISEENYVGTMQSRRGKLAAPPYPKAGERITALADRVAPDGIEVFLGIRSPAQYLNSVFGHGLISGTQVPLDKYKRRNGLGGVDWADLVARLAQTPGVKALTVWRYEDYQPLFHTICSALLGPQVGPLIPQLEERVHRGLSTQAAAELMRTGQQAGDIRDRMPITPDNPAFDGFDADEHALADEFYSVQCAQIAAMANVTLLAP